MFSIEIDIEVLMSTPLLVQLSGASDHRRSRFQVVRVFRARYGLPPHTYQLCSRIARARALLRAGHTPAEVSALCGFADQSHFGRHFKRLVGATPARYAHAHGSARHSKLRGAIDEASAFSGELTLLTRT